MATFVSPCCSVVFSLASSPPVCVYCVRMPDSFVAIPPAPEKCCATAAKLLVNAAFSVAEFTDSVPSTLATMPSPASVLKGVPLGSLTCESIAPLT